MAELKRTEVWEFYISFAMKCADDLRKTLGHDEKEFIYAFPMSYSDPKWILIYRALDEAQKGAICIRNWSEALEDEDKPTPENVPPQVSRIVRQWISDEQSFRRRKLVETLVELICFSRSDDAIYYRDFFVLKELDESVRGVNDQKSFFGFRRANTLSYMQLLAGQLKALEAKLDISKRWYLKPPHRFHQRWLKHGVEFSSFRQRFMSTFDIALPHERTALGKSYLHAYGQSVDVHFSAEQTRVGQRSENVALGVDTIGILCLDIVIRCQHLLGVVPDGMNKRLRDMWDSNTFPAELLKELTTQNFTVGDFVVVRGYNDFCEIVDSQTSSFGYVSYLVRYLVRPPMPSNLEDWFAAGEIQLVLTKAKVLAAFDSIAGDPSVDAETRKRFHKLQESEREDMIRSVAVRLFEALQRIRHSRPKGDQA
jgi:hypothetical protein